MIDAATSVGVVLGSALSPEAIPAAARLADSEGFSTVWLSEDYFFTGGISAAATVLASTERVDVGLGIVSALTRHPALLAMEIATLVRMHPGRLRPAIGLGLPKWIDQMGLTPTSSLGAVRSCLNQIRALLAGEIVTSDEESFVSNRIALTHPCPASMPALRLGVSGPEMLRLAGEIADGVVLSVMSSVEYVRWARLRVAEGAARIGRDPSSVDTTVYTFMSVDEGDGSAARRAVRHQLAFYLAGRPDSALTRACGIVRELTELARGGASAVEAGMPSQWVDALAIAGTAEECAAKIRALHNAGATSVALFPCPVDEVDNIIRTTGQAVLPLLASGPVSADT
jgi:5,10-methylenetetrahydromethanopterin reductase